MQELLNTIGFIQSYIAALQEGIQRTALMLPGLVEQHIETLAKEKLHSSRDSYMEALKVRVEDYVLIMELDEDNWLACAVEDGVDSPWVMNKKHLQSAKAKISKDGYRYMRIPMGKEAGATLGPKAGERAKRIQDKINEVMKRPRMVGGSKLYTNMGGQMRPGVFPGGSIVETQQIQTDDQEISGLYRTRAFANSEQYHQKQMSKTGMPKWNLVMFRTISENPLAKQWVHPGIKGVKFLPETNQWISGIIETLLVQNIERELSKIKLAGSL